jgi:hypothetical protein
MVAERVEELVVARDRWLLVLVGVLMVLQIVAIPMVLWNQPLPLASVVVLVLISSILSQLDRVFFTRLYLTRDALLIVGQLRMARIPNTAMTGVSRVGVLSLFSLFGQRRFSLSRSALQIRLGQGEWRSITISPQDRAGVFHELQQRVHKQKR